jgi:hypothetical protein
MFRVKIHQPLRGANEPPAAAFFAAAKLLVDEEDWEQSAERSELFHSCLLLVQQEESLSFSPAVGDHQPQPLATTTAGMGSLLRIVLEELVFRQL